MRHRGRWFLLWPLRRRRPRWRRRRRRRRRPRWRCQKGGRHWPGAPTPTPPLPLPPTGQAAGATIAAAAWWVVAAAALPPTAASPWRTRGGCGGVGGEASGVARGRRGRKQTAAGGRHRCGGGEARERGKIQRRGGEQGGKWAGVGCERVKRGLGLGSEADDEPACAESRRTGRTRHPSYRLDGLRVARQGCRRAPSQALRHGGAVVASAGRHGGGGRRGGGGDAWMRVRVRGGINGEPAARRGGRDALASAAAKRTSASGRSGRREGGGVGTENDTPTKRRF